MDAASCFYAFWDIPISFNILVKKFYSWIYTRMSDVMLMLDVSLKYVCSLHNESGKTVY